MALIGPMPARCAGYCLVRVGSEESGNPCVPASGAAACGGVLKALCARGITVFFIDHEMRIVLSECDLVYVLAEGRLIARGDPHSVRNDSKVLEAYF